MKHAIHPQIINIHPYCASSHLWSNPCFVIGILCCVRTWTYRLPTVTCVQPVVTEGQRQFRSQTIHDGCDLFFSYLSLAARGQYTVVLRVRRWFLVLLCSGIPTVDTIQENNAENFVMNALDSKWDTQKFEWGNTSLALTFLNQTLLSQQYNTMCQRAQSGFKIKKKNFSGQ
jgi:hypothetical protein